MPRLLLTLLTALFLSTLSAQGPGDYQFQFQIENNLSEWVAATDGNWYGAGWSVSYPGYPMGVPFIIKWNAQKDSLIWKRQVPMPASENVWDLALLPAADGGVYIGVAFDGCDYNTRDGLARLSADGQILWTKQTPSGLVWSSKIWLIPYPDGHLLYHTDHYQIEYDENGEVKWTDEVNFDWNGIAPRLDGGYLVYGNFKVAKTNLLLSIIPYTFPDNILHAHQLPSGNWLFLCPNRIYRVAPDYSVLAYKTLSDVKPWSKIFQTDDIYWVSGENSAQEFELRQIDTTALDVLATHNSGDNYRPNSILHVPGDSLLWLSGNGNFDWNQTIFLKSAPLSKPVVTASRSIALTDIRLEITPEIVANDCDNWSPASSYLVYFGNVYTTVTNTGTEPVHSFLVNGSFTACSFICTRYAHYTRQFFQTLAPGESMELFLWDNFQLDGQFNSSPVQLCFWTALPDNRLDSKPEDDGWCEYFSALVSDVEPILSKNNIQVAPNPASNFTSFTIDSAAPGDTYTIVLHAVSGQRVFQDVFSGSGYQLARNRLPAGLYFYSISKQDRVLGTGKIIFID